VASIFSSVIELT